MSKITVSSEKWTRFAENVYETWGSGPVGSISQKRPGTRSTGFRAKDSDMVIKELLPGRGIHPLSGVYKSAFSGGQGEIMRLLSSHGYGVLNQLDVNGCSPLMYAVMADSKPAIEALMNFSAKKEMKDECGRTAVHYASFFGSHRSLELLIDYACDWSPRDDYGRTSLHWAVAPQSTKCLALLLQHAQIAFEDVNPCDVESMSPVLCAAQYARPKHLELMDQAGCSFTMVDVEGRTALHWTAHHTSDDTLQVVLRAYPMLLNRKDVYGMTALHLAASKGSFVVVEALLSSQNVDVEVKDATGRTALHWGCGSGSVGVVTRLLQYGARESVADKDGLTPLHCAVQQSSPPVVSALMGTEAPTHAQDKGGRTPLVWAAASTSAETMRALLSNEAVRRDVNVKDLEGKTALHYACEGGSGECAELLVQAGAEVNVLDDSELTPLVMACVGGHSQCVKTLADLKCDLDQADSAGNTVAHIAVRFCSGLKRISEEERAVLLPAVGECLEMLGLGGANLDLPNHIGKSAIHMAVECGSELLTEALLRGLANPNVQDSDGYTSLHLAVLQGLERAVALLLQYNADTSLSDSTAKRSTPLDLALMHGHSACADLLREVGGLSQNDIQQFAATCIQSVYRGYRARKTYLSQRSQHKASTVISSTWRGCRVRRVYRQTVIRRQAAIKIQAAYRGYFQRKRFGEVLKAHLKDKEQRELISDFRTQLLQHRDHSVVELISTQPVSTSAPVRDPSKVERERRMRLEQAMGMKNMYSFCGAGWVAFRQDERQRRIDKANRIENERLAQILQCSHNRRKFIESKKIHTWTLRCHVRAATVIQRAYRRWKTEEDLKRRTLEDSARQTLASETRAALRIQIAWRSYTHHCKFIQRYYRVIPTEPTVVLQRPSQAAPKTYISPLKKSVSFADNILITGKPRHKLNLTLDSGIKLVNRSVTTVAHRGRAIGPDTVPRSNVTVSHLISPPAGNGGHFSTHGVGRFARTPTRNHAVSPRGNNSSHFASPPGTSSNHFASLAERKGYSKAWPANVLTSPRKPSAFLPLSQSVVSESGRQSRPNVVSPPRSGGKGLDSSFHLPAIVGK